MSIKTFVGNMKNLWQEQNASKPYVDTEIDKAKAEIISFINKNEIKANMEQIETLALNNEMKIEELLNILDPMKDKLRTLNNNMETIQFIVDAINTKKNNTHKPNKPHCPVIDEDEEETKREMINRLNKELKRIDYLTKRQNTVFAILRNYEEAEFKKVLSINSEIDIKRFLDIWCPVRDGKKHKSIAIKEQNELYNINTKINRKESIQYGM